MIVVSFLLQCTAKAGERARRFLLVFPEGGSLVPEEGVWQGIGSDGVEDKLGACRR
jgi:hypothetical protein